jgi:hypothetical protein
MKTTGTLCSAAAMNMLSKLGSAAAWMLLFTLPLVLFAARLPVAVYYQERLTQGEAVAAGYGFLVLCCVLFWLGKRSTAVRFSRWYLYCYPVFALAVILFGPFQEQHLRSFWVLSALSAISVLTVFYYAGYEHKLSYRGVLGLVLAVTMVVMFELSLRATPADVLSDAVRNTPALIETKGDQMLQGEQGYAGIKPCTKCPDKLVRIVAIGGASTLGYPLKNANYAYPAQLQRLLDQRRPGEKYEVLNAGKTDYSLVQLVELLQAEVLQLKPDIVLVCSGSENTQLVGSTKNKRVLSDREDYQRRVFLIQLSQIPIYRSLRETKLFAFYRYYLLAVRDMMLTWINAGRSETKARVNAQDYKWALGQITEMSRQNHFIPVFVVEPGNHASGLAGNETMQMLAQVAAQKQITLVNPYPLIDQAKDARLFYDACLPNIYGHAIMAEAVYDALFRQHPSPEFNSLWQARTVNFLCPKAAPVVHLQWAAANLDKELRMRASAPNLTAGTAVLEVSREGQVIAQLPGLGPEEKTFSCSVAQLAGDLPIVDLVFRARMADSAENKCSSVGTSGACLPVHLHVISGGAQAGQEVQIRVDGQRYDYDHRGYNIVVIGGKSGEVKESRFFDLSQGRSEGKKLVRFIGGVTRFAEERAVPIVVISVKTDGGQNIMREELSRALRSLGGTGGIPSPFQSFVLIGVPGAQPGSALESASSGLIEIEQGDSKSIAQKLIQVSIDPSSGQRPARP